MKYVYMLQVDWAKDNDGDVNAVLFESYKEASETFEELLYRIGEDEGYVMIDNSVSDKNIPIKTIVLFDYNEIFDEHDNLKERYEITEKYQDDPDHPEIYYHIKDRDNYGYHLFIDLRKMTVREEDNL